jgi:hypothetical protein
MTTPTTKFIYRDYQLSGDTLLKEGLDDEKHLLWKLGGIPCIDSVRVWDKYHWYFKRVQISTKKGRVFRIGEEEFNKNKKEIDFGYGKQYYVEKKYWHVFDPVHKQKEFEKEKIEEENKNQLKLL